MAKAGPFRSTCISSGWCVLLLTHPPVCSVPHMGRHGWSHPCSYQSRFAAEWIWTQPLPTPLCLGRQENVPMAFLLPSCSASWEPSAPLWATSGASPEDFLLSHLPGRGLCAVACRDIRIWVQSLQDQSLTTLIAMMGIKLDFRTLGGTYGSLMWHFK